MKTLPFIATASQYRAIPQRMANIDRWVRELDASMLADGVSEKDRRHVLRGLSSCRVRLAAGAARYVRRQRRQTVKRRRQPR